MTGLTIAYDFDTAVRAWSRVPVDDVGYLSTEDMLTWSDDRLRQTVMDMERIRYNPHDWRNRLNTWRTFFGLDTTHGQTILDFGCGVGLEALQFAKAGNRVLLADIAPSNLHLAARVLRLFGHEPLAMLPIYARAPFVHLPLTPVDVFYASGVLHHTPEIATILRAVLPVVREARLLVYSDLRWSAQVGEADPDPHMDVTQHPAFHAWVKMCDEVGAYADWYSPERLAWRVAGIARITQTAYIGTGWFLGAILEAVD